MYSVFYVTIRKWGRLAYTADNLYDIINDKIGKLRREHLEPVPYEHSIAKC